MNDAILELFETPARNYCAKIGLDPDVQIPVPSTTVLGADMLVPQWHFAARELHDLSLKINALREAAGQRPPRVQ